MVVQEIGEKVDERRCLGLPAGPGQGRGGYLIA